jgi:hypothetical protein
MNGLVRENVIYMTFTFQLVLLVRMRITTVLVKLVSPSYRRLPDGAKSTIKFCVEVKRTATDTFETLTSAFCEECLSRTSVFE